VKQHSQLLTILYSTGYR